MARAQSAPVPVMSAGNQATGTAGAAPSGAASAGTAGATQAGVKSGRKGAAHAATSSGAKRRTGSGPYGASFDGSGARGLSWPRRHTTPGVHPYDEIEWELRTASISNESGKSVFEQKDVEVPKFWSQLATNVVVSKYFRGHVGTPERERSVKQLIDRVVNTIAAWAETQHYFATDEDLAAFKAELTHLLVHQKMAFNSPVWFNVGVEPRPQCSACFINSVQDNMGSIMDLAKTEAMLFKFGSGAGSNLSPIRSSRERMTGGGTASGPVSFMKGYDAFAGVVKCLTGDTYVTTGGGLLRIDEAIETEGPVGFEASDALTLNTPAGPTRISHLYRSPLASVRTAKLRTGLELTGTDEHPVLSLTSGFKLQWKKLADLRAGDRVAVERRRELWPSRAPSLDTFASDLVVERRKLRYPTEMTPQLARLLGYLVAEGSVEGERFRFSSADPEVMADYCQCVDAVFGVDPSSQVRSRVHPITGVMTESVALSWKGALQFLEYCGLPASLSAQKNVPISIRRSPRSLVLEFLGAYTEGDGHVGGTRLEYTTASRRLAQELQLLALNLGVVGRRSTVNGYEHVNFLGADGARLARLLHPYLVTPRKRAAAADAVESHHARTTNPNLDVIPGLVPALRALSLGGGWFQSAEGSLARTGLGIFNRTSDNVSYGRASAVPGLLDKVGRLSPALAGTLESVLDDQYLWDEVVSVSDAGRAFTYDFTVPEVHAFVSNGIVSHNSGGKTRRAAKMVILDADHPDVLDFIDSKMLEEKKAWALIEQGYDPSFTGEAYGSVFFQNANHSVRVTDEFMNAVVNDGEWTTHAVVDGAPMGTYRARDIFRRMADAAHLCGDPGIQYDTTINNWNPVSNSDRQYATNPCSEYSFLNDTSCFAPETRISTPDGLRTVAELYQAQERGEKVLVTTDLHGENDHRRMTAHRPALVTLVGDRQVYRMTLKDGRSIRTTGDHKFLTDNGTWKQVDELTPGTDRVEIRELGNPVRFDSSLEEVRRWQMLGWMTGDGVFSKDVAALVFGPDEAATADTLTDEFNRLLAEARAQEAVVEGFERVIRPGTTLTNDGIFPPAGNRSSTSVATQANGVMQVSSKSGGLVRMLEDRYGMHQGTAIHKDVPTEVHRVADDLKVAYLQGLFSADGSIFEVAAATEPQVMLASSAPALVRSVQLLLSDLGITSRATWIQPKGRANPQAQLHIYNQAARTFMSLIGFPLSERKQAKVQATLARSFDGARKNPRATTVVSIVPDGIETVYDVTEPVTHSLIAEGLIAHNCNLASVNLMTFVDADGEFNVEDYRYACRVTITAQEILVDNASYPTPKIEENSHRFRPLGIGYANLGALLMSRGLAYDSDEGRNFAAALTAIMTAETYRQSATIARDHGGPFIEYAKNREPFLRVIGMHRDAAYRIAEAGVPTDIGASARELWDEALALGEQHGYRNAQISLLAPTGTISFMMDCDTTGVEPDIALIKYKKLVGEGFLKIVNQTVPAALRKLGYGPDQVDEILAYLTEHETIEGAPGLKPEHLPVFDCAFKPQNGVRSIHYMGHVRMMGAIQPFLSGAISKTVNMPEAATAEEIEQVYLEGWKRGLKAIAIYRDNSKRSQPLSTGKKKDGDAVAEVDSAVVEQLRKQLAAAQAEAVKPHRRRLPAERAAVTHKFDIAGHEGYITVGLYPDGQPGEIFLKMAKEGSTVSGLMDTFATTVSVALQYGVPLKDLVNKFAHVRFEPSGFTGNQEIPIAKSIVDYIFRWLGSRFLSVEDKANLGLIDRSAIVDAPPASGSGSSTGLLAGGGPGSRDELATGTPPPSAAAGSPVDRPQSPSPAGRDATDDAPPRATAVATTPAPEEGGRVAELAVIAANGHAGNGKAGNGNGGGGITLALGNVKVAFAMQGDAPSCMDCGSIMVRNGSCYKCLNCGSTSGCS